MSIKNLHPAWRDNLRPVIGMLHLPALAGAPLHRLSINEIRDAMLAAWTTPTTRGRVYGFHRGMDHLGAVVGPALATLFLVFYPGEYRKLFALTIIPGAIAVGLIFLVPDDEVRLKADPTMGIVGSTTGTVGSGFSRTGEPLPHRFHLFIAVLALFMLGNSSDAFLLLRLTDAAGSVRYAPRKRCSIRLADSTRRARFNRCRRGRPLRSG